MSFEDMMDQQLFEPAGMATASARYADFLAQPDRPPSTPGSTGTGFLDGHVSPMPRLQRAESASLMDMTRWLRMQLNGGSRWRADRQRGRAGADTQTPHIVLGPPGTYDGQTISYGLSW